MLRSAVILLLFCFVHCVHPVTLPTTPALKEIQCSASLKPGHIYVKQFEDPNLTVIRCEAVLRDPFRQRDTFSSPVFDVSFGLTPSTGIFIKRGRATCEDRKSHCWSDFTITPRALVELINAEKTTTTTADSLDDNKSVVSHAERVIEYTCNIADTSSNTSSAVRCSQSGTIHFAKVLKLGERCSQADDNECGLNMKCGDGRCQCRDGTFQYSLARDEQLCLEKATVGERCNFTKQCTEYEHDSLCELDTILGFRICKCLSGFEEKLLESRLICNRIEETNHVIVLTPPPVVEQVEQRQVENLDSEKENFSRASQLGLIVFCAVLLVAIVIVAFIIRSRKRGMKQINKKPSKQQSTNGKNELHGASGLLASGGERNTEDEEVEVSIEPEVPANKLIEYDDEEKRGNFNYNAKQSIV